MIVICDRHNVLSHSVLNNIYQYFMRKNKEVKCYDFSNISDMLDFTKSKIFNDDLIILADPLVALTFIILKPAAVKNAYYFCFEMWGYDVSDTSMRNILRNVLFKISNCTALKIYPVIIFSNELRRQYYIEKNSLIRAKSYSFENYYMKMQTSEEVVGCSNEYLSQLDAIMKKHNVITCYVGAIQAGRKVEMIASSFDAAPPEVCLVVAGEDRVGISWSSFNKGNVYYLGILNRLEIAKLYGVVKWGFMDYDNLLLNTRYCSPLKLYEYLAYDIGIICNKNYSMLLKNNLIDYYYENEEDLKVILRKLHHTIPLKKDVDECEFMNKFEELLGNIGIRE